MRAISNTCTTVLYNNFYISFAPKSWFQKDFGSFISSVITACVRCASVPLPKSERRQQDNDDLPADPVIVIVLSLVLNPVVYVLIDFRRSCAHLSNTCADKPAPTLEGYSTYCVGEEEQSSRNRSSGRKLCCWFLNHQSLNLSTGHSYSIRYSDTHYTPALDSSCGLNTIRSTPVIVSSDPLLVICSIIYLQSISKTYSLIHQSD